MDSTEYKVCSYPEKKECINSVVFLNTDDHAVYMGLHSGACELCFICCSHWEYTQ